MLNQVVMVGRLTKDPEITKSDKGKEYSHVTLAIPRSFKNADGEYDTDFIRCTLWEGTAQNTAHFCKKGDIIGVKGRIQSSNFEKEGEKKSVIDIIAEKVTFLSSNHDKEKKQKVQA